MVMRPIRLPPWRSRRALAFGAAAVGLVLIAGVLLFRPHAAGGGDDAPQSAVVEARPFVATLGVSGVVAPGDVVGVTAPFDGKITQVGFDYGAAVSQGQVLITLDTADIAQRRDEAEAEYLKAAQAAADMARWSSGPEVSQARRSEASAQYDLGETTRKLADSKVLLDKGLIARDEYDGLIQQQHSQDLALTAARQDLAEALKKGDAGAQRVTAIELETAKARLAELAGDEAGAVVRAPVGGIIVHPPGEKGEGGAAALHLGMSLSKGQLIGAIAHPGGLAVAFQLSEADANRVHPGQRVTVTGPGFEGLTLNATIAQVAGEATPGSSGDGPAVTFAASARLDPLTSAQAAIVRIGMSANVAIDLYRNPNALVAPAAAIQGDAPDTFVMVKDGNGGARQVAVRIGHVAPDGVEVLSGLRAGDGVVWGGAAGTQQGADAD